VRKLGVSRQLFEQLDEPALPTEPFMYAERRIRLVALGHRIDIDGRYYSVLQSVARVQVGDGATDTGSLVYFLEWLGPWRGKF
jgi:hypothetical protein